MRPAVFRESLFTSKRKIRKVYGYGEIYPEKNINCNPGSDRYYHH